MTNNELYLAISELVNNNSKELEYRMDIMDHKIDALDHRIDALESRIDALDHKIDGVEKSLKDEIRSIHLKLENLIEPRLQNIEACYLSTFERYQVNVEKFDRMQLDIEVLKSIVRKHDEILCPQPA